MAHDLTRSAHASAVICRGRRSIGYDRRPRRAGTHVGRFALAVFGGAVLLFLCLPIAVVVPMSFSSASSLAFPPPGLSLRWYRTSSAIRVGRAPQDVGAGRARLEPRRAGPRQHRRLWPGARRLRGRALLEGNFIAPLILPPVITAVALYIFFAQIGCSAPFPGLVIAHDPDRALRRAADVRGDPAVRRPHRAGRLQPGPWFRMFRSVLLPKLPSVLAAWIFAFIISFR